MRSLPLVALVTRLLTCTAATPTSGTSFNFESVGSSSTGANGQGTSSSSFRSPTSSSTELASNEDRTFPTAQMTAEETKLLQGLAGGTGDKLVGGTSWQNIANRAVEKAALEQQETAAALKKAMEVEGAVVKKVNTKKIVLKGDKGEWRTMPGAKKDYVLTEDATAQLAHAEQDRLNQAALYKPGPKTADSLRREMEITPGLKIVPKEFLKADVGRAKQRFNQDRRELTCSVVSNTKENKNHQVLLISSSNPKKIEWLLPKGGWNSDETLIRSARREIIEEAGVSVNKQVTKLGVRHVTVKDGEEKSGYVYNTLAMDVDTVYDQWAESIRQRIWVTYDDAINILKDERPHMAAIVGDAAMKRKELENKVA